MTENVYQSYTPLADERLTGIGVYIRRFGELKGATNIRLETSDENGKPSGELATPQAEWNVAARDIAPQWHILKFEADPPVVLKAGRTYWFVYPR